MDLQYIPYTVLLAPGVASCAVFFLLSSAVDTSSGRVRAAFIAGIFFIIARYWLWRLFDTVLPAHGSALENAWVWFVFFTETLILIDVTLLFLVFTRPTNRSAEADAHEARWRANPDALPCVDILIATYNEPLQVLEKTIVGAVSLDYPNFRVFVLDDGRRAWLRAYCETKGVGYITRPDNKGAKAGNINHALTQLDNEYFAIFDADFVPQRSFLMRTMGFFEDPKVGIVQTPHTFYNNDPMQTNLRMQKAIPDDQRFFFEAVMPCRDGWDVAFCCGSNSVTRRSAMKMVGDALPEGSITEDILLSMTLLQKGYVTRYLNEPLALGLAPESTDAFFVQRQRWARGAIQTLFLKTGPLGPRQKPLHRLLFLPIPWVSQNLTAFVNVLIPPVFLWTGASPLVDATTDEIVFYTLPMVFALMGGLYLCARNEYYPIAQQVLNTFQSFRLLPTVIATFIKPHGHVFKVTPKGAQGAGTYETRVLWACVVLIALTVGGLLVNADTSLRIVSDDVLLPAAAAWAFVNIIILFLTCLLCLRGTAPRGEERFPFAERVYVRAGEALPWPARGVDLSLTGMLFDMKDGSGLAPPLSRGDSVTVTIAEVGAVTGRIMRYADGRAGIVFHNVAPLQHDLLIRKIFTSGGNPKAVKVSLLEATVEMLHRIFVLNEPVRPGPGEVEPTEAPVAAVREEKLSPATRVVAPEPSHALAEAAARAGFDAAA